MAVVAAVEASVLAEVVVSSSGSGLHSPARRTSINDRSSSNNNNNNNNSHNSIGSSGRPDSTRGVGTIACLLPWWPARTLPFRMSSNNSFALNTYPQRFLHRSVGRPTRQLLCEFSCRLCVFFGRRPRAVKSAVDTLAAEIAWTAGSLRFMLELFDDRAVVMQFVHPGKSSVFSSAGTMSGSFASALLARGRAQYALSISRPTSSVSPSTVTKDPPFGGNNLPSVFAVQSLGKINGFYIGDSGSSCHMTNDANGMYNVSSPPTEPTENHNT